MGKIKYLLIALFLLGVMNSQFSFATTYYVSLTGNDANDGTSMSTPWQTLRHVSTRGFVVGDVIKFLREERYLNLIILLQELIYG
ncbi:MAG: hypothetical protein IPM96_20435 [Ignavibacteria bacterium]|nr:hypothetical protein [Ignavibacteria bacterium]